MSSAEWKNIQPEVRWGWSRRELILAFIDRLTKERLWSMMASKSGFAIG
jgi:hypothetical protein